MGLPWGFATPTIGGLVSTAMMLLSAIWLGVAVMSKPRGQKLLAVPYGYGYKLPATSPSGGFSLKIRVLSMKIAISILLILIGYSSFAYADSSSDKLNNASHEVFLELHKIYEDKWKATAVLYICEKEGLVSALSEYDHLENLDKSVLIISSVQVEDNMTIDYISSVSNNVYFLTEGYLKGQKLAYYNFYTAFSEDPVLQGALCASSINLAEKFIDNNHKRKNDLLKSTNQALEEMKK